MPGNGGGRALVITDPTLLVRHANDRLVMIRDRKEVAAIPVADVSHVALHGPITMTGAAVARLLDAGVEIALHSSSGRYRGAITSAQPKNVFLLLAQVDAWNRADRRLAFARSLVMGKIAGQRQLLQRHSLDHGSAACAEAARRLAVLEEKAAEQEDVDALRGMEGAASLAYFEAFAEMVGEGWTFPGRVRRPPKDPVNALLSFGYTIATGEVARHLTVAGFDTRIGLLHGVRYGRESLPLDLVEELRAPMVDRFTLRVLHLQQIGHDDFETHENGAVRLTDGARRRYLELWEEMLVRRAPRMRNEAREESAAPAERMTGEEGVEPEPGEITWRHRIERQVHRLKRFLLKGVPYQALQATRKARHAVGEGGPEDVEEKEEA